MSLTEDRKTRIEKKRKENIAKRIAESKDLWEIEAELEEFAKRHDAEYFCTIIFRKIDPEPESVPYQAIFRKGEIAEKIFREKFKRVQEYQFSVRKP